jgi:hypothetical protein
VVEIALREKYRKNVVKKIKGGSNDQGNKKRKKKPAPVARLRVLVLSEGRKLRFEDR